MPHRTHLILGATGLVGSELLRQSLDDPRVTRVVVIARRATGITHAKLDQRIFELMEMEQHAHAFANVDALFCALGTTIKTAGSQERFRVVDHDLPLLAARVAHAHHVPHYLLVSALGANARSRVFYNRVKGETEEDLRAIGFPTLTIARPSLLLGNRTEYRRGERIAAKLAFLMPPSMKPVQASAVARAMIASSFDDAPGVRVIESKAM
jgi:uncharacterized protein YbjT (DUF2867 family)